MKVAERFLKRGKIKIYEYRYDIFSLVVMIGFISWFLYPIFGDGHIVFSDMAFGYVRPERYMEEIFGVWNERWSTSTLLNIPRLLYILPIWGISMLVGDDGSLFPKMFIAVLLMTSSVSMYLFSKRLISIYFGADFNFFKIFALVTGAVFYAINPWVIVRIQHIYLLCGYSLFPLLLLYFFNIADPKFQKHKIKDYSPFDRKLTYENVKDIVIFSLIYTVSAGAIHYFFYGIIYFGVILMLIVAKNLIKFRNRSREEIAGFLINLIKKISLFSFIFICVSFFWLGMYVGSIALKAQASQHNINVVDTLMLFSRNSSFKNVLYLISYWWPMFSLESLDYSFYFSGGLLLFFIIYAAVFRAYKDNIIMFFTILSIIFVILATGVKNQHFADIFVIVVTKTPVIGSMFRDPNKFIGLMALGFSLLLTFGVEHMLSSLSKNIYHQMIKGIIVTSVIVSMWFYVQPFHREFIEGFYSPVEVADESREIQERFEDAGGFENKVLYLPIADNMTQSHTGVATPKWNRNSKVSGSIKATGDVHVYSSMKNTFFHHEGNLMSITYFLNYIQYLMDRGYSSNLGRIISAFPINEIAYHDEYMGNEDRQDFNRRIMDIQGGLEKTHEDDIYSLYSLEEEIPYIYNIPYKIFTPYGYSRFELYSQNQNFNFRDFGVIFTNIGYKKSHLSSVNEGDYIEAQSFNDIFLSSLPQKYYILPFEHIHDGNPFLKWSKTLAKNNDWLWFLQSQGMKNFPFDMDMGAGIGVTFSTSRLDILPYKMEQTSGEVIADFDSLLRTEKFFKADNPQLFSVQANPKKDNNRIPTLKGEIIQGDPKNIWQVAKSGLLDAKEDNPYKFNIVVSGRGTNKMHVKVRFFDENMKELGVSYVVAPKEEINFDEVNFYGEYVSPAKSRYMRMDLLTFQSRRQKNYWWIHDIKIEDMEKYKTKNTFDMDLESEDGGKAFIYARVLKSKAGGILDVRINEETRIIDTKDESISQFQWVNLGVMDLEKGKNDIIVENKEGFNAINIFAYVPLDKLKDLSYPVKTAIERSRVFMALEAENDFDYEGNIQSERAYPILSSGRGIRSQSGKLKKRIEIVKDGYYSVLSRLEGPVKYGGNALFKISDIYGNTVFENRIDMDSGRLIKDDARGDIVIDRDYSKAFAQQYKTIDGTLENMREVELKEIALKRGEYKIEIDYDSKVDSISSFEDMHKFKPEEVKDPEFYEDIFQEDCSDCSYISEDMMQDVKSQGFMRIEYEKT